MSRDRLTWLHATLRGLAVFLYFFFAIVWLPDLILRLGPVASASKVVRDLFVLVIWAVGLGTGMWILRATQKRGLI